MILTEYNFFFLSCLIKLQGTSYDRSLVKKATIEKVTNSHVLKNLQQLIEQQRHKQVQSVACEQVNLNTYLIKFTLAGVEEHVFNQHRVRFVTNFEDVFGINQTKALVGSLKIVQCLRVEKRVTRSEKNLCKNTSVKSKKVMFTKTETLNQIQSSDQKRFA